MPIAFNEPLSFLQRITEYMEHVDLIHRASCQPQALERMQVGGGPLPGAPDTRLWCSVSMTPREWPRGDRPAWLPLTPGCRPALCLGSS